MHAHGVRRQSAKLKSTSDSSHPFDLVQKHLTGTEAYFIKSTSPTALYLMQRTAALNYPSKGAE